jgi:hypothetical protein
MLADLFDATFRTMGRTWLTALACGGVLFIPAAILYALSFSRLVDAALAMAGNEEPATALLSLGLAYAWIILAALVQGFAILFVRACVTECTARVARGEEARLFAVVRHVGRHRYGRLIGQRALLWTILGVTFVVPNVVGAVVLGVTTGLNGLGGTTLAGVLAFAAGIVVGTVLLIWLWIRWSLGLEAIVIENARIEQSLDRSADLVRGAWWRVLGYTLLISLMVSFAISLIATPIVFFASIRLYAGFLRDLASGTEGGEDLTSLGRSVLSGIGSRLGLLVYLQSLCGAFVLPVFMTHLFLELRKRTDAPGPAVEIASTPPAAPEQLP